jgi:hypothetical protein
MKRMFLSLVMVFGLMLSPSPFANAATEGCPNNWSIDKSISGGWAELNQAKARLGSNMVLEFDEYSMIYSDFSGELGPMPKPSVNLLGVPDLYLYGNTKVAFKVTVQVKDCQGKTTFLLQGGSLKQYLGLKANPTFIQMNAGDFATNRSNSFIDFVKAREFPACIASLTKGFTNRAAASGVSYYQWISPRWPIWNSEFCGLYTGGGVNAANPILLNLTPGCSLVDAESNDIPRRLGISVAPNKTCEFAFAFSDSLYSGTEAFLGAAINPRVIQTPVYVLESFKVSGPVTKKTTITCIKGKLTKKVTGIKPACATGYKKK